MTAAATLLAGTIPTARVAMLFSYDSRWAIDLQRHHRDFDPIREFVDFYRPLRNLAQGVAVVAPDTDLSRYPLVVAPSLNILPADTAHRLESYVRAGGHLVLGPRSGMKDEANALWPQRQPGPLVAALGARVEQFHALDRDASLDGDLGVASATVWAEILEPEARDVQVLARYRDPGSWLDGRPAIVTRPLGRGRITYVGAWLKPDGMATLAARLLQDAAITPILPGLPAEVEVAERAGQGRRVVILINHGTEARAVPLPAGARVVGGDLRDGALAPHGVALIRLR